MLRLHVYGFNGKTWTLFFPAETFKQTTISEFKYQLELKMGIKTENPCFMYASKQLETRRNDIEMTFKDYNISEGSTIIQVLRLSGGGGSNFVPLSFTDITSGDKFKPIEFVDSAPLWRRVEEGLNFEGICKKFSCKAYNKAVMVRKGFYDTTSGQCMLNYEICQWECPMCGTKLDKENVTGVGIYRCKLEVKAKRERQDEIRYEMESTDKFRFAHSLDGKDKIDYEYIILIVKRL